MTVRELIKKLEECDDDIKDYEACITFSIQISPDVRLSGRCYKVIIQDNADIDSKRLWIKAR